MHTLLQTFAFVDVKSAATENVQITSVTASDAEKEHSKDHQRSAGEEKKHQEEREHVVVAVDVGPSYHDWLEFIVMLHSSWQYVVSEDDGSPHNFLVDLLVACEECTRLPIDCRPLVLDNGEIRDPVSQHRCMWVKNDDLNLNYFKRMRHAAMLSVSFLTLKPIQSVLPRYKYVLRTDQDAVITPRILTWRPPHGMVFGNAGVEIAFTKSRLEAIAKELGWRHQKIHNICSGWYAPPDLTVKLAENTIAAAKHLLENEFGYRFDKGDDGYMADKVKLGGLEWWKKGNKFGEWPKWWQGVTSLYASNLAINHIVDNLTKDMVTQDVDYATLMQGSAMEHVHLHAIHGEGGFNKFRFRDQLLHHEINRRRLGEFEQMNDDVWRHWDKGHSNLSIILGDASKYTTWIASRGIAVAAEVFHPDEMKMKEIGKEDEPLFYRLLSARSHSHLY